MLAIVRLALDDFDETHVGQGVDPPLMSPILKYLLVHTFMAMFLVLQNLVACIQTKITKIVFSLSHFQCYVMGMLTHLCFFVLGWQVP